MTTGKDMDGALVEAVSTVEMAEALRASGAVDDLLAQIDTGEVALTGEGGLLPGLIKLALERGLAAELTDHLGYEKGCGDKFLYWYQALEFPVWSTTRMHWRDCDVKITGNPAIGERFLDTVNLI